MSAIAIIPARGGSQRIPRKNIRMFHGKPIIAYSIEAAKASGLFDEIVVSTDDEAIRDVAWASGAKYLEREPAYATGDVQTKALMTREIERLGLATATQVCCIYPTAPLMHPSDLSWGQSLLILRPAYFVVPVGTEPLADAGQFYWSLAAHWGDPQLPIYSMRTAYLPLPSERVCDINVEDDWIRAERMYIELHKDCAHG